MPSVFKKKTNSKKKSVVQSVQSERNKKAKAKNKK